VGHRERLVLASASPQRRALLERLGVEFALAPQEVQELEAGDPFEVVRENALRKARAARAAGAAGTVLGCDTVVALDGEIYGKPADEAEARETLRALAGATHEVLGGIALVDGEQERTGVERTEVAFRGFTDGLIDWYLALGEWRGRAGGYAIQGAGAALVRCVRGDYENVVGLPLGMLLEMYPQLLGRETDVR
jgi:septum formation protein